MSDPDALAAALGQAYAEYHGSRYTLQQRVLWQGPWKFVFNGFDFDELYNLDDDPHELDNLADRSEHEPRMKAMMAEMWRIMHTTGEPLAPGNALFRPCASPSSAPMPGWRRARATRSALATEGGAGSVIETA